MTGLICRAASRGRWTIDEANDACFIVRNKTGRSWPTFTSFENEPGRRPAANPLTRDKVRRIGANIAKLPELVQQASALQITIVHRRRTG